MGFISPSDIASPPTLFPKHMRVRTCTHKRRRKISKPPKKQRLIPSPCSQEAATRGREKV